VIRRLSGVDGSDVWTSTIAPPPGEDVNAVSAALDGAGHLIVVGITYPFSGLDGAWLVAAVREADGAFLWNQAIEGRGARPDAYERTWSVAGASGSAYVIGALGSRSSGSEFAVVAINGATGAERWRYVPKGHGIAWGSGRAVASAADGSLVVTGSVSDSQGHQDMFIARLGADDGRAIWEQLPRLSAFPTRGLGSGIAFDSQGNIGVIGELDHPLVADAAPAIVKLRFTDGSFGVAQPPRPHRTKGTSEP